MSLNPKLLYPKYLQRIRPGQRLPIKKISSEEYSTAEDIKIVLQNYEKRLKKLKETRRVLIVAHGRLHPKHPDLPIKRAVLLDLNPVAIPDIVGNVKHVGFMKRFPANYFDEIILTYTPPPSPISPTNANIWPNLQRILKPGGLLRSNYIMHVFLKKKLDLQVAKKKTLKYFKKLKLFRKVEIVRSWTHLTK